jgi:glucokinase-like ROK family protein
VRRRYQTGDHALVRRINLSAVMNCLQERSPLSRAQLADVTGLNKATVSSLVAQLLERHYLREIGRGPASPGRPGVLLELNPGAGTIVGLEFGVDFLLLLLTDFKAQTLWRHEEKTGADRRAPAVIQRACELLAEAFARSHELDLPVLGMGVGVPGLIDVETGTVLFAPNLAWRDVPLRDELHQRFQVPVHVDNDANTAALGEKYFGVARNSENFVYLGAGVGLGGGIFIGGQLFRGQEGYAGEIGHMTMQVDDGLPCNCGNRGCWETLVSQTAVLCRVRQAVAAGQPSRAAAIPGDPDSVDIERVLLAAEDGDAVARTALEDTARYLGIGAANLVSVFNPEIVILGGILSRAGSILLPIVERTLKERTFYQLHDKTRVTLATHGFDACVRGGVALVLDSILSQASMAAHV